MNLVHFQITVSSEGPLDASFTGPAETQTGTWDVERFGITPIKKNEYRIEISFASDDVDSLSSNAVDLYRIRDEIVGILTLSAMRPLKFQDPGQFIFQLSDGIERNIQLQGPGFDPRETRIDCDPLLHVGKMNPRVSTALYLFCAATATRNTFARFVNLAMLFELLASESTVKSAKNHFCPSCKWKLQNCPQCSRDWPRPLKTLREKLKPIIEEKGLLARFIDARNLAFHGRPNDPQSRAMLADMNHELHHIARNCIGKKLGLPDAPMTPNIAEWVREDLTIVSQERCVRTEGMNQAANIAISAVEHRENRKFSEAIEKTKRALDMYEREKSPHGVANQHMNLAIIYCEMNDWRPAERHFDLSVGITEREMKKKVRPHHLVGLAIVLSNRGNMFGKRRLFAKALKDHERSVEILEGLISEEGRTDLGARLEFAVRCRDYDKLWLE